MSKKQLSYVIASISLMLGASFYFMGNFMLDIRYEQLREDNGELFDEVAKVEPIRVIEVEYNIDPVFSIEDQEVLDEYDKVTSNLNLMENFILFVSLGLCIIAVIVFAKAYKSKSSNKS